MLGTLLSLLAPLISGFVLMIGYGLIGILLPVRMGLEEMSTDTVGLILSMYAVGMLFGGLYSRYLINRAGHIRMFAACAAFAAVSILACGLYTHPVLWGLMRICLGFCNACAFTAIDSWLSGVATEKTRGRILATNQISIMTAIFIGQFGLNVADPASNTLFILAGMVLSLAVIPMVMSRSSGPVIEEGGSMPIMRLLFVSPLGVVSCFFGGVLYAGGMNMLPLFGNSHGIEGFQLSQFMGAAVFGALALQFPVGFLSDRMDRRTLMIGILLVSAVACMAVPVVASTGNFELLMLSIAIVIGVFACLYPMAVSEAFDKLPQKDLVSAMGSLIAVYALGSMVGPYSASLVMSAIGPNSLFGFLAMVTLGLIAFIVYRMFAREARPIEDQESYVPLTFEGSAVVQLDPRAEYVEPDEELSGDAKYALSLAEDTPGAAVTLAKTLGLRSPEDAAALAGSLAQVDGVNAVRLYNSISRALPDVKIQLAEAVATGSPENASEIIRQIGDDHPDDYSEYVTAVAMAVPEHGADVVASAAEAIAEESPEEAVEIAQNYAETLSDSLDEMRPADREAEHPEDVLTEIVSRIAEAVPDHAVDVATVMVEALPETASDVIDSLHDAEDPEFDELSSSLDDAPDHESVIEKPEADG